jgi:Tfp pilus assembly protein PilN
MILINLLPDEYRQRRRTPVKLLMSVTAAVAINGTLAAYWAWTAFGVAAEVKSELLVLQDTRAGLDPQVAYHQDLEKESKSFDTRENTLNKVTVGRVSWTRKIDELVDVVNIGGDGEKYLIWLNDLQIEQKENARSKSYGRLRASGNSGSQNFSHVANFLEDLENSPFSQDFKPPAPPEGSSSTRDEGLMPNEIWSFPLEVELTSPEERHAVVDAKADAKGKSAKPGPAKRSNKK